MEYNFTEIEKKWQQYWKDNKTFHAEVDKNKPKFYVLDMFPYPSGAGLHVGHPLGYIASDIFSRYKRLKGFNVLHPMGYDAFGLPAEQYAIQTGQHPAITTEQNIKRYREQLDKIGFSFDWEREVRTSNPNYYKWTQWIFLKLFNSWYNQETDKAEGIEILINQFKIQNSKFKIEGKEKNWNELNEKEQSDILMNYRLAYLSETFVNWCPQLGTVLANEEVKDGVSERGGYPVERKLMKQWSLRITVYSERLLNDLDAIDWSESIKESQRNWIGKSEGASIKFRIQNSEFRIEVFTTRPDTIFGVSFLTLAPENELVEKITTAEYKKQVEEYIHYAKNRSERERQSDVKKITGQFTGTFAVHPFTGKQIPIWTSDYVLAGYGTGAVMGVPAHDSRDFAFANHFDLEKQIVIQPPVEWDFNEQSYDEKSGKCINSDFLNGLTVQDAIKRAIEEIEKQNLGKSKINYRLRDAIFGRQRYWGEPIPIYYKDEIPYPIDESELPLLLPEVDKFLPTETGEPPLARAKNWTYSPLLGRGVGGEVYPLETTTMPGWAASSWYYLRYMDANNEKEFVSKDAVNYWKKVDLYIGGAEHATGHLLYVRFWTKFLHDLGYLPIIEPAKKLINQGMIQGVSEKIFMRGFDYSDKLSGITLSTESLGNTTNLYDIDLGVVKTGIPISTINNPVNTFYSADIYEKFLKESKVFHCTSINVPIDIVKDSILDLNFFIAKRPEYKDAAFVTNDGRYWKNGKFWKDNQLSSVNTGRQDCFKTKPEVEKMSKSKYNVINPDEMCEKYGADTFRMYEMFLGPLEQSKPWNTNGITGVHNFLRKFWRLFHLTPSPSPKERGAMPSQNEAGGKVLSFGEDLGEVFVSDEAPTKQELKILHKTIKKVEEDIEHFSFNTSVSGFMICVNELTDLKCNKKAILEPLLILISSYAPHIAEELWQQLGHTESISYAAFPKYEEKYLTEDAFDYPISFNGKTRMKLTIPLGLSKEEIEKFVLSAVDVQKYLNGANPKKIVIVPGKIVNMVM